MPKQNNKSSILLIDDSELSRESLAELLRQEDFEVRTAEGPEKTYQELKAGFSPTFIFADREFPDQMIEDRALIELKRLAPESLVIVFTRKTELSWQDRYAIQAGGAVRILDKKAMGKKRIAEIKTLTQEIGELFELRSALRRATE